MGFDCVKPLLNEHTNLIIVCLEVCNLNKNNIVKKSIISKLQKDKSDPPNKNNMGDLTNQILSMGAVTPSDGEHCIHCLTIVGQVEGHYILPPQNKTTKYEHVMPQLVAIEEDSQIDGLLIILNTVGGDVEAGLAIAELVAGMKKPTVSVVLGGGHSIGVPLAVCAKRSFIVQSATMTIHPVRLTGMILGVPQSFSNVDKIQERIVTFVSNNSSISKNRMRELMMNKDELVMDVGSILEGQQAVEEGLIDRLGGLSDAISELHNMIDKSKPQEDLG